MKKLGLLVFILLIQSAFALTQKESIRIISLKMSPVEFSVEHEIQEGIKKMLFEQLKIKKSVITVDLRINTVKLLRTHGLYQKNQMKDNLPGIDTPPNIAEEKLKTFVANRNDLLTHISGVFINFSFPHKIVKQNQDTINEFVYEYLNSLKVRRGGIRIKYSEIKEISQLYDNELKPDYLKSFTEKMSNPENKDTLSMAFMLVIAFFLVVILGVIFLFIKEFKKMQSGIVSSLKGIELTVPESKQQSNQDAYSTADVSDATVKTYEEIRGEIFKVFTQSKILFDKTVQICVSGSDLELLFILKDIGNEQMQTQLLSAVPKIMNDDLSKMMKKVSVNPQSFYQNLAMHAENTLKSLWLAKQDPSILDYGILNKKLADMSNDQLAETLVNLDDTEFSVVMIELPRNRAAAILSNNASLLASRTSLVDDVLMTPQLIKGIHLKLDGANNLSERVEESKLSGLSGYLSEDVERIWIEKMGLTQTSLHQITSEEIEKYRDYFSNLDIAEISELLAILDDEKKEIILGQLPEIKRNRIILKGYKVTNRSYNLKADLVNMLKSREG